MSTVTTTPTGETERNAAITMFEPKYSEYGVLKIESGNVVVYCDRFNSKTIHVGSAVSAIWAGSFLNVTMSSGRVRRYFDFYNFQEI